MKRVTVSGTANAVLQNTINTSVVFNYLRDTGPAERAKIARDLHLSAPTVSRVIEKLRADQFILEAGVGITDLGKKAQMFKINTEGFFVIGIDLVKNRVRTAVYDLAGHVVENHEGFRFSEETNVAEALFREIDASLEEVRSSPRPGAPRELKAIAVGVPAVCDPGTGRITGAILYENLVGLDIGEVLHRRYSVPTYVENVSNLSAFAEHASGVGKDFTNLIFIEFSRGVGAGLILDNELFRAKSGAAGEIGFSITSKDGLSYHNMSMGHLESHVSLDAIARRGARACLEEPHSLIAEYAQGDPGRAGASLVCRCALEGDPAARRIIEEAVERLSLVVVNLVAAVSPEIIIFGGDLCALPGVHELFLAPVENTVARVIPFSHPSVVLSHFKEDACVAGAAALAIESLFDGHYPYRI
jgi:predicted NBD/HSP70 family sugar kinase